MAKLTAREIEYRDEALTALRDLLPPGSDVLTISRKDSEWTTYYSVVVARGDDVIVLDHWMRNAGIGSTDRRRGYRPGVASSGIGLSRSFQLVYDMGRTLYPDGFPCAGERCPSNEHANGDRDYTPGHVIHSDGGYALRERDL